MEREFVTYEQALALKELGFGEECFGWYNYGELLEFGYDHILDMYAGEDKRPIAPLKSQVFRWFREKYELIAGIRYNKFPDMNGKQYYYECDYKNSYERYNTYEEAENAAIDKLIELAKQQDSDETK